MSEMTRMIVIGISFLLALSALGIPIDTMFRDWKKNKAQDVTDYRNKEQDIVVDSLWEDKVFGTQWCITDVDNTFVSTRPLYLEQGKSSSMRMIKGIFLDNYQYHGMMYWDSDSFLDSLSGRG